MNRQRIPFSSWWWEFVQPIQRRLYDILSNASKSKADVLSISQEKPFHLNIWEICPKDISHAAAYNCGRLFYTRSRFFVCVENSFERLWNVWNIRSDTLIRIWYRAKLHGRFWCVHGCVNLWPINGDRWKSPTAIQMLQMQPLGTVCFPTVFFIAHFDVVFASKFLIQTFWYEFKLDVAS